MSNIGNSDNNEIVQRVTQMWDGPNLAGRPVCSFKACQDTSCDKCWVGRINRRLAKLENILCDDFGQYNIIRLQELVEADREGRAVIFKKGYSILNSYSPKDEDGLYIKQSCGVIDEEEYLAVKNSEKSQDTQQIY